MFQACRGSVIFVIFVIFVMLAIPVRLMVLTTLLPRRLGGGGAPLVCAYLAPFALKLPSPLRPYFQGQAEFFERCCFWASP